jgi:hypothetical protein
MSAPSGLINYGLILGTAVASGASDQSAFHPDFILGAVGQQSDNDTDTDNWCSQKYHFDFGASTAPTVFDLKATEGFSRKTKCSW